MLCDNCRKYEARTQDYRDVDGCIGKVYHCFWCAGLNDVALYRIRAEGIDPIDLYDTIHFEKMSDDELMEVSSVVYEEIENCLDDAGLLNKFNMYNEVIRELTLREQIK